MWGNGYLWLIGIVTGVESGTGFRHFTGLDSTGAERPSGGSCFPIPAGSSGLDYSAIVPFLTDD